MSEATLMPYNYYTHLDLEASECSLSCRGGQEVVQKHVREQSTLPYLVTGLALIAHQRTLVLTCLSSYSGEDVTVLGSMCVHNTVTPPQATRVEKKL